MNYHMSIVSLFFCSSPIDDVKEKHFEFLEYFSVVHTNLYRYVTTIIFRQVF